MIKRCNGFTMIELVMVMVIIGILSAYALPRLNFAGHDANGCAETLKASIRLAQKLAIAQRAAATPVTVTSACAVSVGTDVYPALNGVTVTNFTTVTFNGQGQPSVGDVLTTAVRAFTITGGDVSRVVFLEPETGYVHE
jgi:prepilin-type N-terminal cleavage/methylation domain-containing protein